MVSENSELRNFIAKIDDQLNSSPPDFSSQESLPESTNDAPSKKTNPLCEMPAEIMQETLYNSIVNKISKLSEQRLQSVRSSLSSLNDEKEMKLSDKKLKKQENYRESLLTDDEDSF